MTKIEVSSVYIKYYQEILPLFLVSYGLYIPHFFVCILRGDNTLELSEKTNIIDISCFETTANKILLIPLNEYRHYLTRVVSYLYILYKKNYCLYNL